MLYAESAHCVFCRKEKTCLIYNDLRVCPKCLKPVYTEHFALNSSKAKKGNVITRWWNRKGKRDHFGRIVPWDDLKTLCEKYPEIMNWKV